MGESLEYPIPKPAEDSKKIEIILRATDPKDYIRQTAFQKKARLIDSDPNHPWEAATNSILYFSDQEGTVCLAQVYNPETKSKNLIIALQTKGKEAQAAYLTNLTPAIQGVLIDTIALIRLYFPGQQRQAFISELLATIDQLEKLTPDQAAEKITVLALNQIKNSSDLKNGQLLKPLPRAQNGPSQANKEQQEQLERVFSLVRQKTTPEEFKSIIAEFYKNIPFIDDVYGKNFKLLFIDILKQTVNACLDFQQPKGQTEKDLALPFPVEKLAKRKVGNKEEAKAILEKETVKPAPDIRLMAKKEPYADFVDLEKVVGGIGIENWARINDAPKQALEKIMNLIQGLSSGYIDLTGGYDPIEVYKINGEYYVLEDGRHRIAALKTLGVPFAPMLVNPCN